MVDSSKWSVIEAGLRCIPGKPIVNSLSLKEGEDAFRERAKLVRRYGAAAVIMAFDEKGQADSLRAPHRDLRARLQDPRRGSRLSRPRTSSSIPNVLTVATGIEEHNNYAVDFIEATRWIKANLPRRARLRRHQQHLVFVPRQQPGARGDARGVSLPRDPRRARHGHRQRGHARGLRGDRAAAQGTGRGRDPQSPARRDRAAGRPSPRASRRAARPRRRKRRSGARCRSRSGSATRWSRASSITSTPTPRRRARNTPRRSR